MLIDKILDYIRKKPRNQSYKLGPGVVDGSGKNQKYLSSYPISLKKNIEIFPNNKKLQREKFFVLNGDASNLRIVAETKDGNGDGVEQWTVDGNKIRLSLFNGITLLSKLQENAIIADTAGFGELEQRGSWFDAGSDFLNVIWGMYVQRKEGTKNGFSFFTRSLRHNKQIRSGMGGTAYKGHLDIEGSMSVKKEIWHIGGYQFSKKYQVLDHDIFDERIGYAVGLFNFVYEDEKKGVCVMQFLDEKCDGSWQLKYLRCDREDMGWGKKGDQGGEKFGGKYDQLITWGSPKVTFRWDNSITWFDSPFAYEFDVTADMVKTARNAPLIEPK